MNDIVILGLDPAKLKFTACAIDLDGRTLMAARDFAARREGLETLMAELRPHLAAAGRLMVGIEASASLDDNLLAWFASPLEGVEVTLLRLDAAQVRSFSGARPVRGKTDRADARRIAEFTRLYGAELHGFENDPQTQTMARLVNERSGLVHETTAVKNRLHDRLVISFPEFVDVFKNPCTPLALCVLQAAPTAAHCARKRPGSLARLQVRKHGHHLGEKRAGRLLERAKRSIASATEDFDADAIRFLAAKIELNRQRIAQIEAQLDAYAYSEPLREPRSGSGPQASPAEPSPLPSIPQQIQIAISMPGIAVVGAATVILRSRGLTRFTCAKALAAQLGVCPDRRQTGSSLNKASLTHRGDRRTRSTVYLLTQMACHYDPAMAFHRWRFERKGLTPKQAVCACMNRYVKILWTLVDTQTLYDPARAVANAQRHHPELWKTFQQQRLSTRKKQSGRTQTDAIAA